MISFYLAYRSWQKPCTEVTYTTSVDRFFLSSSEMRNCSEKGGKVMFQLSRHVDIEIVRIKCWKSWISDLKIASSGGLHNKGGGPGIRNWRSSWLVPGLVFDEFWNVSYRCYKIFEKPFYQAQKSKSKGLKSNIDMN